ncbi:hypothetical protein ACA910_011123 [Epithemia clementina (nom. ined.)]
MNDTLSGVGSTATLMDEARIEELLSEKLVEGFLLLERSCPRCLTPLVKQEAEKHYFERNHQHNDVNSPIPGIPFCVSCRAHIMTNESDMVRIQRHFHGQTLQGRILMDFNNGGPDINRSLIDDDESVDTDASSVDTRPQFTPHPQQRGQYRPQNQQRRGFLSPPVATTDDAALGEFDVILRASSLASESPQHNPQIDVLDSEEVELICSLSLVGSDSPGASTTRRPIRDVTSKEFSDAESMVASVMASFDQDDDEARQDQNTSLRDKSPSMYSRASSIQSKVIVKARTDLTKGTEFSTPTSEYTNSATPGSTISKAVVKGGSVSTVSTRSSQPSPFSNEGDGVSPSESAATHGKRASPGADKITTDPAWPKFEERKMIATKVLSVKMLQGHKLLQKQCRNCSMPMTEFKGHISCAVCPILQRRVAKAHENKSPNVKSKSLPKQDNGIQDNRTAVQKKKNMFFENAKNRVAASPAVVVPTSMMQESPGNKKPFHDYGTSNQPLNQPAQTTAGIADSAIADNRPPEENYRDKGVLLLKPVVGETGEFFQNTPLVAGRAVLSETTTTTNTDIHNHRLGGLEKKSLSNVQSNDETATTHSIADSSPRESRGGRDINHDHQLALSKNHSNQTLRTANFAVAKQGARFANNVVARQNTSLILPINRFLCSAVDAPLIQKKGRVSGGSASENASLLSRASSRPSEAPRGVVSSNAPTNLGKPYLKRSVDPSGNKDEHAHNVKQKTQDDMPKGRPVRPVMGIAKVMPQPLWDTSKPGDQQAQAAKGLVTSSGNNTEPESNNTESRTPSDENSSEISSVHSDSTISSKTKVYFKETGFEATHQHGHKNSSQNVLKRDPGRDKQEAKQNPGTNNALKATVYEEDEGAQPSHPANSTTLQQRKNSLFVDCAPNQKNGTNNENNQPATDEGEDRNGTSNYDYHEASDRKDHIVNQTSMHSPGTQHERTLLTQEKQAIPVLTVISEDETSGSENRDEAAEEGGVETTASFYEESLREQQETRELPHRKDHIVNQTSMHSPDETSGSENRDEAAEEGGVETTASFYEESLRKQQETRELPPRIASKASQLEEHNNSAFLLEHNLGEHSDGENPAFPSPAKSLSRSLSKSLSRDFTAKPQEEEAVRSTREDAPSHVSEKPSPDGILALADGTSRQASPSISPAASDSGPAPATEQDVMRIASAKESSEEDPSNFAETEHEHYEKDTATFKQKESTTAAIETKTSYDKINAKKGRSYSSQGIDQRGSNRTLKPAVEEDPSPSDSFGNLPNQQSSLSEALSHETNFLPFDNGHGPVSASPTNTFKNRSDSRIPSRKTKRKSVLGEFETRRQVASKEIGKRMAKGWILLNSVCPKCSTPLMTDTFGRLEICVICGPANGGGNDSVGDVSGNERAIVPAATMDSTLHTDHSHESKKKRGAVDPWAIESYEGGDSSSDEDSEDHGAAETILKYATNDGKNHGARAIWSSIAKNNLVRVGKEGGSRNDPPAVQGYTLRRREACDPDTKQNSDHTRFVPVPKEGGEQKDPADNRIKGSNTGRKDPESSSEMKHAPNERDEPEGDGNSPRRRNEAYKYQEAASKSDIESIRAKAASMRGEYPESHGTIEAATSNERGFTKQQEELEYFEEEQGPYQSAEETPTIAQTFSDADSDIAVSLSRVSEPVDARQISAAADDMKLPETPASFTVDEPLASPLSTGAVRHEEGKIIVQGDDENEVFTLAIPAGFDVNNEVALRQLIAAAKRGIPLNVDTGFHHHEETHFRREASPGLSAARAPHFPSSVGKSRSGTQSSTVSQASESFLYSPTTSKVRARITPENMARNRQSSSRTTKTSSAMTSSRYSVGLTPEEPHILRSASSRPRRPSPDAHVQTVRSLSSGSDDQSGVSPRSPKSAIDASSGRSPRSAIDASSGRSPRSAIDASSARSPTPRSEARNAHFATNLVEEAHGFRSFSSTGSNSYEEVVQKPYQTLSSNSESPSHFGMSQLSSSPSNMLSSSQGFSQESKKPSNSTSGSSSTQMTPIYGNSARNKRANYRIRPEASHSPETIIIIEEGIDEEEPEVHSTASDAESTSVTSEAIDALLKRIEQTQAQLAAAGDEEDSHAKREKLAELLGQLSAAAAAVEELDDNYSIFTEE